MTLHAAGAHSDGRSLRILTQALVLAPVGGVEVCTFEDVRALIERRHHVDIEYAIDGQFRPPLEQSGVELQQVRRFSFDRRNALRDVLGFVPDGLWARGRRPDLLWLNRIEHLVWAQAVARIAGLPVVSHLHGPPVHRNTARTASGVAHFVAVSEYIRDAYVARGIARERISVIHNALPVGRFVPASDQRRRAARAELGLPADGPVVLAYGQMTVEKGITDLLDAWRSVSATVPSATLVLVDAKSVDPDPVVGAAIRVMPDARIRPFPMTVDVTPYLNAADVVVFPTRLPEAFGRVALEGMASGLPVIAARVGAVPEIVPERFLVEPQQPGQLAAALIRVLTWRENEPSLGPALAADADRRFPYAQHIDRLEAVLLRHARPPRRR